MRPDKSGVLLVMPVKELWQVEIMRQIYNQCLEGYTKQLEPIGEYEQQEWWSGQDGTRAYLYLPVREPWRFIGFSCLRALGDQAMSPIMGIKPDERGKGYGRAVVQHYIEMANMPMIGESLVGNTAINTINSQLGWKVMREEDGVLKLFHPHKVPDARQQECYDEIVRYHSDLQP